MDLIAVNSSKLEFRQKKRIFFISFKGPQKFCDAHILIHEYVDFACRSYTRAGEVYSHQFEVLRRKDSR